MKKLKITKTVLQVIYQYNIINYHSSAMQQFKKPHRTKLKLDWLKPPKRQGHS